MQFFQVPCQDVYNIINHVHSDIEKLEQKYLTLKNSASLFELNPPCSDKLISCRNELKMIKVTFQHECLRYLIIQQ